MAYRALPSIFTQFELSSGAPAVGYYIFVYIYNTTTPAALYTSSAGAGSATSFALNSNGIPQTSGGTEIPMLFGDTAQTAGYKINLCSSNDDAAIVRTYAGPIFPTASAGDIAAVTTTTVNHTDITSNTQTTEEYLDNRHVVSPKDYGGVADGATDATSAVVSALASGYPVYFGDENDNWLVSGNIAISNSVVCYGRNATITINNNQNSNGLYAASAIDYFILDGIDFAHTRTGGIYTQAVTLHNCNRIRITNSNADSMTQFSYNFIYDVAGTYESIYVDNVHVTNAGNTANGVNNCYQVLARTVDATVNNYYLGNSSFQTYAAVGGNIAKLGVAKNMLVENVRFISSSRTGASYSSGVEYGSDSGNTYAATMNVTMRNVVIDDGNNTGLYPLLARSGTLLLENCNISNSTGDYGIYCGNSTATKIHIKGGSCERIFLEGSSLNLGELIIDEGAEVTQVNYEVASTSAVAKIRVTGGAKITRQITTRNSNLQRLELDGAVFPIADLEHYLYGSAACLLKGCEVYAGASVSAATNAFSFYSNGVADGNDIRLAANRTDYLTVANGAVLTSLNNTMTKSNDSPFGIISGTHMVLPSNVINGAIHGAAATTVQLTSLTAEINTIGKYAGKQVKNTTTNLLLTAAGSAASDHWYSAAGVDTHTPI